MIALVEGLFQGVQPRSRQEGLVGAEHPTKIAQLELLTVYVGFIFVASQARSCQGPWFVDNIAALMALVRGRSDNPECSSLLSSQRLLF